MPLCLKESTRAKKAPKAVDVTLFAISSPFYAFFYGRLVSLEIKHVDWVNADIDYCRFHCVTGNEELVSKLEDSLEMVNPVNNKSLKDHRIIVSHPHGQPKHISIGKEVTPPQHVDDDFTKAYNTPTCPGSSGAAAGCLVGHDRWVTAYIVHTVRDSQMVSM